MLGSGLCRKGYPFVAAKGNRIVKYSRAPEQSSTSCSSANTSKNSHTLQRYSNACIECKDSLSLAVERHPTVNLNLSV